MKDLERLEELARGATAGPWDLANGRYGGVIRGGPLQQFTNGSARSQIVMCCGAEWMRPRELEANAAFISAANPDTVLELVLQIKQLRGDQANCKPSKCCPGELLVPLHSTNTKICTGCHTEQPWPLEPGQKRTYE